MRHAGMQPWALSLMTSMATGMADETLGHAHTPATAKAAGERAVDLVAEVLQTSKP
jgi:purine nucleoside phosphorylase